MARVALAPDSDLAVAEDRAAGELAEAAEPVALAVQGAAGAVVLPCGILPGPAAVATAKALARVDLVEEAPAAEDLEAVVVLVGAGPVAEESALVAGEPGVAVGEPGVAVGEPGVAVGEREEELVVQVARAEPGPVAEELRLAVVSRRLQENG
jgi:hypothetical protein